MATITVPSAGDSITATYGAAVANAINDTLDESRMPYAHPLGFRPSTTSDNTSTLAVVAAGSGGAVLIPMEVSFPMYLDSYSWRNASTASLRTAEFRLYQDIGTTTLQYVTGTSATASFTPSAASDETSSTVASVPVLLAPGIYWLAIRNTSTAQTFTIRRVTPSELVFDTNLTNASIAALGTTLSTSGWAAGTNLWCVRLNGRINGASSVF